MSQVDSQSFWKRTKWMRSRSIGRLAGWWLMVWLGLAVLVPGSIIYAQEPLVWETPIIISQPGTFNWYPDIAVDGYGTVHVVWDGGLSLSDKLSRPGKFIRLVMYSQRKDGDWSTPLDVVSRVDELVTMADIYQANLSVDSSDEVLLSYAGELYRARFDDAPRSAAEWTGVTVSGGVSYLGKMLVDQNGTLHALYDEVSLVKSIRETLESELGLLAGQIQSLSDIKTRRSFDDGLTWTAPSDMSQTSVGETRANLELDSKGVIYATWDEGWDRLTREGEPAEGVLMFSEDGGVTWSARQSFSYPDRHNVQFVATGNGQGGILAVWRTTTDNKILYSWSADQGESWSIPEAIPAIFARTWDDLIFDNYELAADSSGIIHLAAVARLTPFRQRSNLYHLTWDGRAWSSPQQVDRGLGWPEAPRMVISQGNQLQMIWFTRDDLSVTANSQYQIWYSHATLNLPAEPLLPPPTPTPLPTVTPLPTALPGANFKGGSSALSAEDLAKVRGMTATPMENNLNASLSIGLLPVIIAISGYVAWVHLVKSRRRS